LGDQVAVVWKEFDGKITSIKTIKSGDGGLSWSKAKQVAESPAASAHPALIHDGKRLFVSWHSADKGFQLLRVD
jgi:hypothetical protein